MELAACERRKNFSLTQVESEPPGGDRLCLNRRRPGMDVGGWLRSLGLDQYEANEIVAARRVFGVELHMT